MGALKADNDRLQRMVTSPSPGGRGLNTSQSSLAHSRTGSSSDTLERSLSMPEQPSLEMLLAETPERGGTRVTITVYLGSNPDPLRMGLGAIADVLIGSLAVSGKTKWDMLDNVVRKILKVIQCILIFDTIFYEEITLYPDAANLKMNYQ